MARRRPPTVHGMTVIDKPAGLLSVILCPLGALTLLRADEEQTVAGRREGLDEAVHKTGQA